LTGAFTPQIHVESIKINEEMIMSNNTVLIVDDNPTNLGLLIEYLDGKGFNILAAEHGEDALEQLEFTIPDIILLDVMMPGIDGFETCRRLKDNPKTSHIPVIFMTARTEIVDKAKGFNVGAVDYVTKPVQQEEVLARVTTHLMISNLQKELELAKAEIAQLQDQLNEKGVQ
jgi:DNA-binding response OmpR family regulator